ncbi:unnamed protein product [Closterium sp. Naga37s-1]|nr:unnamed protein product [Closterium sp. Naga37s-1]
MACLHINSLPDELLVAVFWPSKRLFSREHFDEDVWAAVRPPPRFNREDPDEACYQQSETMFPAPPLPPAFADAAYNLLLASICRRWRRLARRHVSTLLVKTNRAVSLEDLAAPVKCFPNLTRLHLNDGSAQAIDDAFLARLAACCPNLTAFHLGRPIVENPEFDQAGKIFLTPAGFDAFFRRCPRLEHLSLACLHCEFRLPSSLFHLVHLRSLAVADLPAVTTPKVKNLSALTSLWIDSVGDYQTLEHLAHLPRLTHLSVPEDVSPWQYHSASPPFSFARLSSLKTLNLGKACPPFDEMFPPESPCSLLERIDACGTFFDVPEQATALTRLRTLKLENCTVVGLPDSFGQMPALTTLVLHNLNTHFPGSCSRLQSLETLIVTESVYMGELPDPLSALTVLKTLCLANSPLVILPADIGGLTNLHTLYLKSYRARHLLPPSFTQLASLTRLELHKCELAELPEAMGELTRLRELYVLSCSRIQKLPESVAALLNLDVLVVDKCSSLFSVPSHEPHAFGDAEAAGADRLCAAEKGSRVLAGVAGNAQAGDLSGGHPSAGSLSSLEHLRLVLACEGELPFPLADLPRLRTIALVSTGVVKLPDFSTSTLQELRQLELCLPELTEIPSTIAALQKLTNLEINAPKLRALPNSIGALSRLCKLIMSNCLALTHLPASLTQLACLRELTVHKAAITSLPPNFARLSRLQALDLEGCKQLEALPGDVGELELLDRTATRACPAPTLFIPLSPLIPSSPPLHHTFITNQNSHSLPSFSPLPTFPHPPPNSLPNSPRAPLLSPPAHLEAGVRDLATEARTFVLHGLFSPSPSPLPAISQHSPCPHNSPSPRPRLPAPQPHLEEGVGDLHQLHLHAPLRAQARVIGAARLVRGRVGGGGEGGS